MNGTNGVKNNKVSWKVFVWIIGVILLLFSITSGLIATSNSQVDKNREDIVEVKVFMGVTSESLKNIEATLIRIESQFGKEIK